MDRPNPKMIAEIPASALQMPDNTLWILGGWIFTILLAGWSGYRWGLRSQIHAEKLKAKNAALAVMDGILIDVPKQKNFAGFVQ